MKEKSRALQAIVKDNISRLYQLNEMEVTRKSSPEKWSKKEILGHLIDSAANNHQRFVRAQQRDTLVFPEYDQDEWVRTQHYQDIAWSELIKFWEQYNLHIAMIIELYPEKALKTIWRKEPNNAVTIRELINHYLWHTQHHLNQILL